MPDALEIGSPRIARGRRRLWAWRIESSEADCVIRRVVRRRRCYMVPGILFNWDPASQLTGGGFPLVTFALPELPSAQRLMRLPVISAQFSSFQRCPVACGWLGTGCWLVVCGGTAACGGVGDFCVSESAAALAQTIAMNKPAMKLGANRFILRLQTLGKSV